MEHLVLSVLPEYANQIANGKKLYEVRTKEFSVKDRKFYIYSTKPEGLVLCRCEFDEPITGNAEELFTLYGLNSKIHYKDYIEYLRNRKPYFYPIRNVEVYKVSPTLTSKAPQFYRAVNRAEAHSLIYNNEVHKVRN